MSIVIIDYGMGNLASVSRAFAECGVPATVSDDPDSAREAGKLLLPGVGSFAMAMDNIRKTGWKDRIDDAVRDRNVPLLGICLGMQLLAEEGEEHGTTPGLGYIPGRVRKFDMQDLRIPHVGWNEIRKTQDNAITSGIDSETDFYFVHSYYFDAANPADVQATTPYGVDFASIVGRGNVWGTQFHPEKSGAAGLRILRNFAAS